MKSATYRDIIEEKIEEWLSNLKKLEEQAEQATSETQKRLSAKAKQIRIGINQAQTQLRQLDEHETVENTMETKDKILKIFSTVDQEFAGTEESSPFML